MSLLLLSPRLDVTFKEGPVPSERGYIPPIRKHWLNFRLSLNSAAFDAGIDYMDIEKPLWQFKEEDFLYVKYQNILVPHKEFHNFIVPGKAVFYYMQSVIPHYFTIDRKGWGGNLSVLPYRATRNKFEHWDVLKERINQNVSKFDQPAKTLDIDPGYVLFICQIPHDQTIQYHSTVSVYSALEETIRICRMQKKRLVVKGHPVNPTSMETLRRLVTITNDKDIIWVDDVSIHSLIENASQCVTVNSGSGIEVILHEKPIYAFGKAEYSELVPHCSLSEWLDFGASVDIYDYMNFIEAYVDSMYDSRDPESFKKLFI